MFSSSTRFDSETRTTILDYFVNKKKKIVRLFVLVSHQVALVGCHGFGRNFVFFFFFFNLKSADSNFFDVCKPYYK